MHPAIKNLKASGRVEKGMWWEKAWRLVEGCSKVSPGCLNCWSETQCNIRAHNPKMIHQYPPEVLTNGKWNGQVKFLEQNLNIPLKRKKPTVFAVWNDLFYPSISATYIDKVLEIIEFCPQHIFIMLTKRPENIMEMIYKTTANKPLRCFDSGNRLPENLWLGVTAENQEQANKRIPILLQIPATVRFISVEPMLGSVDLSNITLNSPIPIEHGQIEGISYTKLDCLEGNFGHDTPFLPKNGRGINWVILGGESGHKARPMHPDWARGVRDQCVEAGIPFFFKQLGEFKQATEPQEVRSKKTGNFSTIPAEKCFLRVGKKKAGRELDGQTWSQFPKEETL